MSSKTLDPSLISADDVYTRMIDLKFPAELAERFKNEMKEGLQKYVQAEEIPLVKSNDIASIMALVKLLESFIGGKFEERVNQVNSTVSQLITSDLCPINSNVTKTTDESVLKTVDTKLEQSQPEALSQSKVKTDKEPFKNISNTAASTSSSVMNNRDSSQSGKLPQSSIKQPESLAYYEFSNIRIFICEQLVNFPKFTDTIEADLNCEGKTEKKFEIKFREV